jgi:hypothetical protein
MWIIEHLERMYTKKPVRADCGCMGTRSNINKNITMALQNLKTYAKYVVVEVVVLRGPQIYSCAG